MRREGREEVAKLQPCDRLALAFQLGEFDLELLQGKAGLDRRAAQRHFELRKQAGRRASACIRAVIE